MIMPKPELAKMNIRAAFADMDIEGKQLAEKPNVVPVESVSTLTDAQVRELRAGDIVVKEDHTYIVSCKEDDEMCLVYTDHTIIEEVWYHVVEGQWVYGQTDITRFSDWKGFNGVVNFRGHGVITLPIADNPKINGIYIAVNADEDNSILGIFIENYNIYTGTTGVIIGYESYSTVRGSADSTATLTSTNYSDILKQYVYGAYDLWDTTPTENSTKPVTSGGIYTALQNAGGTKLYKHTFDDTANVRILKLINTYPEPITNSQAVLNNIHLEFSGYAQGFFNSICLTAGYGGTNNSLYITYLQLDTTNNTFEFKTTSIDLTQVTDTVTEL